MATKGQGFPTPLVIKQDAAQPHQKHGLVQRKLRRGNEINDDLFRHLFDR